MATRTRVRGRSGLAAYPAVDGGGSIVENVNGAPALKPAEQVVAMVLRELLQGDAARVAQTQLVEVTGYGTKAVRSAVSGLESKGLLRVERAEAWGVPNLYELSGSCITEALTTLVASEGSSAWMLEPLPDCFRAAGYTSAGWLWRLAPKDEPMRMRDIRALFPGTARPTVARCLKRLAELPVPALETLEQGSPGRSGVYHFRSLTEDDISENLAWLMEQESRYQPKTLAERQGYHDQQREQMWKVKGRLSYTELAPMILAASSQVPWPDDQGPTGPGTPWNVGCIEVPADWRDEHGYGRVPNAGPAARAHRIVWTAEVGQIRTGHQIHHAVCANPACVNIWHLAEVSRAEHQWITNRERPWRAAYRNGGGTVEVTISVPPIPPCPVDDDSNTEQHAA